MLLDNEDLEEVQQMYDDTAHSGWQAIEDQAAGMAWLTSRRFMIL